MKTVPTSFDFDGAALRPDYVVKCSYGNDSIALLQFLHEYNQKHPLGKVVVLYNNTGWAAKWWEGRVLNGEKLARSFGFVPMQTQKFDWESMLQYHNSWPDKMTRFCTIEAKIMPTLAWLSENDPDGMSEMVCGVRREESPDRINWPEHSESDFSNEGRPQWSPLVDHNTAQRDALIVRAGWKPLAHRSRECRCVLANSQDIKTWDEEDIQDIEKLESMLVARNPHAEKHDNKMMFRAHKKKGNPQGIRQVVEWAKRVKPKSAKLEPGGGCDSGYCTG